MNKKEIIEQISVNLYISKNDVDSVINEFLNTISFCIKNEETAQITGFGTFTGKKRGVRIISNPRTGEKIEIPASVVPSFKASNVLKKFVNM